MADDPNVIGGAKEFVRDLTGMSPEVHEYLYGDLKRKVDQAVERGRAEERAAQREKAEQLAAYRVDVERQRFAAHLRSEIAKLDDGLRWNPTVMGNVVVVELPAGEEGKLAALLDTLIWLEARSSDA